MIQRQLKLILFFSLCFFVTETAGNSLWTGYSGEMYSSPRKRIQVGDTITVRISETTSAVQEASTRTQKDSKISTDFLSNWDQVANLLGNEQVRKSHQLQFGGEDEYQGLGQTQRRTRVESVVTAVVTEIVETGNLFIVGEHKIKVNDEIETIRISGLVRPQDINSDNSVFSYQIAKVEVSINGAGIIGSKQTPGVLTKMFNWLF